MLELSRTVQEWLGLGTQPQDLAWNHVLARATVMFVAALVMLRFGHKRFFARRNALDVLLTFILASTLARAINGSAPFFPTIVAGFAIILLHRLLSWAAARSVRFERLVKGSATPLVEEGNVDCAALRRHDLSLEDLSEDLRIEGVPRPGAAKRAMLERNGAISVEK